MTSVLTEIINLLTSGLVAMGKGIGGGINAIVSDMFIVTTMGSDGATTQALSTFGSIVIVFTAIALAIGLTKLIYHFLTSLGATGN